MSPPPARQPTLPTGPRARPRDDGADDSDVASTGGEVDAPAPSVEAQPVERAEGGPIDLSSPQLIEDSIEVALDRQLYTFDGSAGDEFSVEINSMNGACDNDDRWAMEVGFLDPTGEPVGRNANLLSCGDALGPWVLTSNGEHTFFVGGDNPSSSRPATGSFSLTVAKLMLNEQEVVLDDTLVIDGGITVPKDRQLFRFDAEAGQRVSVLVNSMNDACSNDDRWAMECGDHRPHRRTGRQERRADLLR